MQKYKKQKDGLYHTSVTVDGKRIRFKGATVRELERNMVQWRDSRERGRVFPAPDGGIMTFAKFNRAFRQYLSDAGLPPDIVPHQFRHSFMTICFEAGIDAQSAAAFLGDTPETALKVYTELRKNKKDKDAEKVAEYLGKRWAIS